MLRDLCPKAHPRYEQSSCTEELEAFADWLLAGGYSRKNTRAHVYRLWCALERAGVRRTDVHFSPSQLARTFTVRGASLGCSLRNQATRRAYERFLCSKDRLDADPAVSTPYAACLEEYEAFLYTERGFAATTRAQHLSTVLQLLGHALGRTQPLATLNSTHVEGFLRAKGAAVSRHTLQHTVAHLRAFLRYGYERGWLPARLDTIDTPRTYRREQPPRALPWPGVLGLLRSIDRSSKAGWRDYTILHLMAYYGLRPCEIVDLTLDAVDFAAGTLCVEQRKTHSQLLLPLAPQTLRLLRRYLRQGRPVTAHRSLFLRVRRPAGRLRHTAVCDLFAKRAREGGLPAGRYSAYSLRHAFAMRLLERGVGVKAIGDLLGHRTLESTCVYLRLDIKALRPVALEVPRDAGVREVHP